MYPHKWLLAALFFLQTTLAYAGCSVGALPFNLQDNTLADATQVMGDFNQIVSGANANCAAAGANNDITSLSALSTPLSPPQGGSAVFAAGTTTGSANAQVMTVNSNWSSGVQGYHVTGFFGFTNTGPMTVSVNGGAALPVLRKTQFGVAGTAGGEAIIGHPFDMISNGGGALLMIGETIIVGEMKTYMVGGGSLPPGWLVADGSSFSCTTFASLCAQIGTTYGGTASNPNLPDTRGRVMTGLDNYFTSTGAAGRLNNIVTGCGTAFSTLGVTCANASERHFQQVNELALHTHTITDPGHGHGITDPGHSHAFSNTVPSTASGAGTTTSTTGANAFLTGTQSNTTGVSVISNITGVAVNNTGSGAAMPIVNPNLGVVMIIRF